MAPKRKAPRKGRGAQEPSSPTPGETQAAAPEIQPLRRISSDELTEMTGLSRRRHEQLAADGFFPQPGRDGYEVGPTIQGLLRYYREKADNARTPLVAIQERKAETEARHAALKLAREERAVIPKSVLAGADKRAIAATKRTLYQVLTVDLPLRLEGKTLPERRAMLRAAGDDICDAMGAIADRPEAEPDADG